MVVDVSSGVILGDVDGEIVALQVETDAYLHLNGSGTFILDCLRRHGARSVDDLCRMIADEYAVDAETCRRETTAFVQRCLSLGLMCEGVSQPVGSENESNY
jgi:hypothetical protein